MTQSFPPKSPRSLFWRLWWRSISVRRPQAALAVASLLVGAAVTSLLLNLYRDVQCKMTQEFRAYGANVVLAPTPGARMDAAGQATLMDEAALGPLQDFARRVPGLVAVPVLYGVARLSRIQPDPRLPEFENVVVVGTDFSALRRLNAGWRTESRAGRAREAVGSAAEELAPGTCVVGAHITARLRVGVGDLLKLEPAVLDAARQEPVTPPCRVSGVLSTGASEDDQVFVPLSDLQGLLGLSGKLSLVELSVPGETAEVERVARALAGALPGVEVRPIRQIVYSAGKVLSTIRWLMLSLTLLILVIIAICVMATMTAIVLERRKDIGVMKALGASDRVVMRFFLAEGAGLGLVGGVAGFFLGAFLARGLARHLFEVALTTSWWTFPLVSGLTALLGVAASVFPVRIVRGIQPAVVLKGE
jgi:putative ABC transport system permease protein